jgi:hypothetical protein
MDIEVQISFDINSVFVQAGKLNKKFSNLIALDKMLNKIVAIGESEQEIAARDPEQWERVKGAIAFKPIFDPRNFDPESMYWAIRMLASNIHYQLRGVNLFDKITCNVNIPKYELFPTTATQHFEMRLERWPKLRTLSINGTTAISKGWQYTLAQLALNGGWYILMALLIIVFATHPALLFNTLASLVEKLSFGIVFVVLLLVFIVIWVAEIAWLLGMQLLLPKKTLRRMFSIYQLQFIPFNKISPSTIFANWILGKGE